MKRNRYEVRKYSRVHWVVWDRETDQQEGRAWNRRVEAERKTARLNSQSAQGAGTMNDTQAQKRHMGTEDEQKMREDMDRVNETVFGREYMEATRSGKPIPKHLYERDGMLWSETLQMYVSIPND